jgi:hypothetical protein
LQLSNNASTSVFERDCRLENTRSMKLRVVPTVVFLSARTRSSSIGLGAMSAIGTIVLDVLVLATTLDAASRSSIRGIPTTTSTPAAMRGSTRTNDNTNYYSEDAMMLSLVGTEPAAPTDPVATATAAMTRRTRRIGIHLIVLPWRRLLLNNNCVVVVPQRQYQPHRQNTSWIGTL